jgi:hypothetical protein
MSTPTPAEELANSRVNAVARRIWAEALAQPEFADVGVIWAYSASSASDHRNGRCCDFMVTYTKRSLTAAQRVALGDRMRAYFVKHAARLHVQGIIWNHKVTGFPIGGGTSSPDVTYRGPSGQARAYAGGDQHTDHVHVQVSGAPVTSWLSTKPVAWDGKSFPGAQAFYIGAHGAYVTKLGERLVAHGWTGYSSGPGPDFSETDRKAVAWFQTKQGWTGAGADGYPGAETWRLLMAAPAAATPKPAPKPATTDTTPEVPKPMFEKVIELDAPGAGNWQGAAQNVKTGEWFIAHSRGRADGAEDVVLYRFDKAGKYQDKMTLEKCSHIYGFGVSDTNVIWVTWNDDTNDVVTLQYEAGKTVSKSAASPMHVFSDGWVDVSFSPSRDWVAHRQRNYPSKGFETYRRYRKDNLVAGVDDKSGVDVVIPTSSSRVVQGFSLVNSNLYVLIGLAPNSAFRIEKWDFKTGKKVGELKLDPRLGLRDGENDKVEPEGMDGRTFGMKVGTDDARRLIVYKLTGF